MRKRKQRNRGYAAKRESGNMMYGPGCCAHSVTQAQMNAARAQAAARGHQFWTPGRSPQLTGGLNGDIVCTNVAEV